MTTPLLPSVSQQSSLSWGAVFAVTGEEAELLTADLPGGDGGDQGQFPEVIVLLCSRYGFSGCQSGPTAALAITCSYHRARIGVPLILVALKLGKASVLCYAAVSCKEGGANRHESPSLLLIICAHLMPDE